MRATCEIKGCNNPVVAHGLCNMHRQRFARHGSVDAGRPEGWGSGANHPLYERWKSMRRTSRLAGGNVSAWDSFWSFVEDIGTPPTPAHRLYRIEKSKPFGPGNFTWRERVSEGKITKGNRQTKTAYMRDYARARPHIMKDKYLRRHYGITLVDYNRMYDGQNGLCAICQQPERAIHVQKGATMLLPVDHDHQTGKVRGLLCTPCNRGLGLFGEDVHRLRSAIAYLERHIDTPTPPA